MRTLDRSRGFGEVMGLEGTVYEQDGHCFNLAGQEITVSGESILAPAGGTSVDPVFLCDDTPPDSPSKFSGMHWKHLKAMVESYGGTWTNKQDAIRFLEGNSGLAA